MAKKNVKKMKTSARLAKEIARRDWLTYISPRGTVDIERSLANFVLRATKGMKPEPNEMDVLSALAGFHWQCRDKMAEIRDDYKQMEVLLPALQNRAIHLFVGDKGKKYVCDTPLLPYHQNALKNPSRSAGSRTGMESRRRSVSVGTNHGAGVNPDL